MKLIIILFLMIGCSKTKYVPLELASVPETRFVWDEGSLDRFDPRVDVMVAFLWPAQIESSDQKIGVRRVISRSRELRQFKANFLTEKIKLQNDFASQNCPCVLDGICTGEETHDDLDLCLTLEEKKYAHQEKLADFYVIVEDIRSTVQSIGGVWVKTNTEYPEAPLSTVDYKNRQLRLEVFEVEEQRTSLTNDFVMRFERGFPELNWNFQVSGSNWSVEASLEIQENLLSGQGEISSGSQKGVIYWEQSPR